MKKLIILVCILHYLISCQVSEDVTTFESMASNQRHEEVNGTVIGDIFVFTNFDSIQNKLDEISKKNDAELLEWVGIHNHGNSMLEYYIELETNYQDHVKNHLDNNTPYIAQDAFSAIINQSGEVIIGNKLYRLQHDRTFEYSVPNNIPLKSFIEDYSKGTPTVEYKNIDNFNKELSNGRFLGSATVTETWGSSNFRCELEAYSQTFGIYSAVGTKIKSYRNRKGKWGNFDSYWLHLDATANTEFCVSGGGCSGKKPIRASKGVSFNNKVDNRINTVFGTGVWHVTEYINATYTVEYQHPWGQLTKTIEWR